MINSSAHNYTTALYMILVERHMWWHRSPYSASCIDHSVLLCIKTLCLKVAINSFSQMRNRPSQENLYFKGSLPLKLTGINSSW